MRCEFNPESVIPIMNDNAGLTLYIILFWSRLYDSLQSMAWKWLSIALVFGGWNLVDDMKEIQSLHKMVYYLSILLIAMEKADVG